MASLQSVQHSNLYKSPIQAENSNFRIVENRIVIDAPHTAVFGFVTNWTNLPKWLPTASDIRVLQGKEDVPTELGDVLYEGIRDSVIHSDGSTPASKVYTVTVKVPGLIWVVTGTDENDTWVRWMAHFSTIPVEGGKTLFCRIFQQMCKDPAEPVSLVIDPAAIQKGLEDLKRAVEAKYLNRSGQ